MAACREEMTSLKSTLSSDGEGGAQGMAVWGEMEGELRGRHTRGDLIVCCVLGLIINGKLHLNI